MLIGYNVPIPRVYGWQTFNITVGQGGDKYGSAQAANGTGSSALGCYVPGGGHGAWGGKLPNVLAAGNGGNGGGSISAASHSAGERLVGLAGLSTISASATTAIGGKYYLYGNDGGFIPGGNFISEGDAPSIGREAYSVNSTHTLPFLEQEMFVIDV